MLMYDISSRWRVYHMARISPSEQETPSTAAIVDGKQLLAEDVRKFISDGKSSRRGKCQDSKENDQ